MYCRGERAKAASGRPTGKARIEDLPFPLHNPFGYANIFDRVHRPMSAAAIVDGGDPDLHTVLKCAELLQALRLLKRRWSERHVTRKRHLAITIKADVPVNGGMTVFANVRDHGF